MSRAFLGIDPKKIPPYQDDAMQARVDKIGASLVPEYQRALPDTDATKLHFRFPLIQTDRFRDALALDSGIILVPKQVVERMQNDAQLAAVLADNIACVLEKQEYRAQPAAKKLTASQVAGDVGGIFVPGLGLATLAVNTKIGLTMLRHAEEQSGRVSLGLLQDAGYDIHEAPKAWWLLAPKNPKAMLDTTMPYRSAYLYGVIGTTWRDEKAAK